MVRGLISERSYPWAVEPAGLSLDPRAGCLLLDTGHTTGKTLWQFQTGSGIMAHPMKSINVLIQIDL